MQEDRYTLNLRLLCLNPPPPEVEGAPAEFGLQDKDGRLLPGKMDVDGALSFDFNVDVLMSGGFPNFLGPFTHGTPLGRFLYLSYRQAGSPEWIRRMKIPVNKITGEQVEAAIRENRTVQATVDGRSAGRVTLTEPWQLA